jgi:hypothetical protein
MFGLPAIIKRRMAIGRTFCDSSSGSTAHWQRRMFPWRSNFCGRCIGSERSRKGYLDQITASGADEILEALFQSAAKKLPALPESFA